LGDLINSALVQTRAVARGLFPVRLEENGLASALEELAANTRSLYEVDCTFLAETASPEISQEIALHLYYVAQEAVLNAAKHGHARHITLTLSYEQERLNLIVQDDGDGFDPGKSHQTGMGIDIMRYRARVIGATLDLQSRPGGGTRVSCVLRPAQADKPQGNGR